MANWRFGAFPKLPYSTMQQLNLDWILDRIRRFLPDTGTIGQVLTRTKDGAAWQDAAAGGGAVDSVNGQTGTVVLDAEDVGALPDTYVAPVTSVNGQTGTVVLDAEDVGALPDTYVAPVTSVNGQTGDVIVSGGGAVDSVNGQTGTVVLDAEDVGAMPDSYVAPVQSVNGQTGVVSLDLGVTSIRADNQGSGSVGVNTGDVSLVGLGCLVQTMYPGRVQVTASKSTIGLGSVANERQYSAQNPPPYPVTSVNGQTGAVVVQAGGITMQALWTNGSPTSSFAGQTINVDLSSYSWFAVKYRFGVTSGTQDDQPLAVFSVDEQSKRLPIAASGNNRTGGRLLTYDATAKTITFANGQYNGATANANAIPIAIYGIGGLTNG